MTVKIYEPRLVPKIFHLWLTGFGATPATAQKLWRTLLAHHTHGEIGAIVRAQRRGDRFAVGEMLATFTPKRMLALCVHLSPEGQPRDPHIIEVERRIVEAAVSPERWR